MMTGSDLMKYLKEQMSPTTYYQPLIISELVRRGGSASQRDLAIALMMGDAGEVRRWEQVVGRWPRQTLRKHGIVSYEPGSKIYRLLVDPGDDAMQKKILEECAIQVTRWQKSAQHRSRSRRYEALRAAAGRCQLCGMPGNLAPLHVDHIIPWSRRTRRSNTVMTPDGQRIDVDDDRNLQVLCSPCNTGKRASDSTDFRPSPQRLADVITAVRDFASKQGISREELERLTTTEP